MIPNFIIKYHLDRLKCLALLRCLLALHIIKKYILLAPHYNLLYSDESFVKWVNGTVHGFIKVSFLNENYVLIIILYLAVAICMLFGIFKNVSIFLVFIFTDLLQRLNGYILDGGDNLLKFVLLYLSFTNSFCYFCLKPTKNGGENAVGLFSLGTISIAIHMALVYFVSATSKINSNVWYNGIATYYTLIGERFEGSAYNKYLVQNAIFVTLSTYVTLLWELSFPFLVWWKRFKYYILGVGILVHMGIYFLMMIHDFQTLYIAIYCIYLKDSDIDFFVKKFHSLFSWSK